MVWHKFIHSNSFNSTCCDRISPALGVLLVIYVTSSQPTSAILAFYVFWWYTTEYTTENHFGKTIASDGETRAFGFGRTKDNRMIFGTRSQSETYCWVDVVTSWTAKQPRTKGLISATLPWQYPGYKICWLLALACPVCHRFPFIVSRPRENVM